jgi:hypothetical protein
MTISFPARVRLTLDLPDRTAHRLRSETLRAAAPSLSTITHAGRILLGALVLSLAALTAHAQKPASPLSAKATPVAPDAPATMTPEAVLNGNAIRLGHLEPAQKMHVVVSLRPPHMAEEEQFINELVTKGSPNFHKFLSPEQWNARFAPSAGDEEALVAWLQSQGFTVTERYANRLLVGADGTVDTVEKAFGVTMNQYQVGGELDFSNDRNPFIPGSLTGIVSNVLGLSNVERVHRLGVSKSQLPSPLPPAGPLTGHMHGDGNSTKASNATSLGSEDTAGAASNPTPADSYPLDDKSGTYAADPDSIQSSQGYDFNALHRLSHCCNEPGNAGGSPPESSIALIGFGAFSTSDISTFASAFGFAYNINWFCFSHSGGTACPGVDDEAPLDVEYAMAMSNSYGSYLDTAHIYEYEMGDGYYDTYSTAFNRILNDNYAKVVSSSYGWEENVGFAGSVATGTMHPIFNNLVGTGFTLIASAGDSGSSAGCAGANAVLYPASDPDFIAAGGTQLLLDSNGIFQSENAWEGEFWSGACSHNWGGGTGGTSVLFFAPTWQQDPSSTASPKNTRPYYGWKGGTAYDGTEYVFTGNGRQVPDISLTANPDVMGQWYFTGGSWTHYGGGTSIVAPELAGFFAQENSYLDYVGNKCGSGSAACSPVGNAAPFIYQAGYSGAPHNPFYDTTNGCDSNDITVASDLYYWCGYSGWDPATGWGSANMLQLAWGINWWLIPAVGSPSLTFSGPTINTWYKTDQAVGWTLSDSGGSLPAPGVAGFTQGWDSIPADPSSEPHGGDGNSFYWGPQFPFASGGCLSLNGGFGCAGGAGQGCHTVRVEGWDNQGRNVTSSYGPICYDTVAPTISVSNSPVQPSSGWWNTSVQVTLNPADSGGSNASGIYKTYYAINTGSCVPGSLGACTVYTGPFTISGQQQSYIYYFTEDNAGNFSGETYEWVSIDLTAPTTTASLSGTIYSGSVYKTAVNVTLNASDTGGSGPKSTYYQLDGGSIVTYAGAFSVSALGSHSVKYWSVDSAGNVESTKTSTFSISSPTTASLVATPNPSLLGQSVTMTATVTATLSGTPTGSVTFWNGATNLGTGTLSGGVATLSTTALPAGALTLQASYTGSGNFLSTNSAPFNQYVGQRAAMISPTAGSVLTGPSATFTWTVGSGVTQYSLHVGTTGAGSTNIFAGAVTGQSKSVSGIPTTGGTVYVRLYSMIAGVWQYNDYTYTEQ